MTDQKGTRIETTRDDEEDKEDEQAKPTPPAEGLGASDDPLSGRPN